MMTEDLQDFTFALMLVHPLNAVQKDKLCRHSNRMNQIFSVWMKLNYHLNLDRYKLKIKINPDVVFFPRTVDPFILLS